MEGAGGRGRGGDSRGVRKGAWSEEEDLLLRKCIEKYGEGKWRQVPLKAGLNRCRKSCRLRWLNYLHPSIKRGEFTFDEVDLIIRMHKLLGNRWSLIAGRLPGRTANDIKNYCNTHLKIMLSSSRHNNKKKEMNKLSADHHHNYDDNQIIKPTAGKKDHHRHHHHHHQITKVLKPQPRTFYSKNSRNRLKASAAGINTTTTTSSTKLAAANKNNNKDDHQAVQMLPTNSSIDGDHDHQFSQNNNEQTTFWLKCILLEDDDDPDMDDFVKRKQGGCNTAFGVEAAGNDADNWSDLYLDDNLWRLLGEEEQETLASSIQL